MESYENVILRRIGYVLFLIVIAVYLFNIGGSEAETPVPAGRTSACAITERYDPDFSCR